MKGALRVMVVHNVIYSQEPDTIDRLFFLDHKADDDARYVDNLGLKQLLQEKNGHLSERLVGDIISGLLIVGPRQAVFHLCQLHVVGLNLSLPLKVR